MKNLGFTLIEFIIYVALFTCVAVIFLGVFSRVQFKLIQNTVQQEILLRQELAIDLLRRDLISSSIFSSDWSELDGVFKKLTLTSKNLPERNDICWFVADQRLMRASGQYDFEKNAWISKSTCVVCKTIRQIKFVLQKGEPPEICTGVWVIYSFIGNNGIKLDKKFFVKFRNRVVA